MSTKFNPLVRKGFDKVGITLDDLPPALDALVVDDTATVDLTLTGDTLTADVKNNSITYAKIQNVSAENKILGRITAGAGDTEELTAANVRTIINVEDGADVTDATNVKTAGAAMAGGAFHDGFSDFVANEHIDWTVDQGATDIHPGNIPDLSGTYLTAETDPDFNAWLLATPPLYPGGWYDAVQNTIGLSGFDNDSGFITSFDDEKVKYDAGDPTAGYVADKIIAGTGISVAEGIGANENKLVVTSDITQYTDSDAIAAIQGDASWNASDWDTAYGWGNHAGLYEPVGTKANKALDNLASVAINTSLISDTDNTDDLGSALKKWANLFVTNIGATATRVTKGWFTDLEVTNAIAGSITGNAGTVTNATLTTALTVNTGTVTLKGNAANNSVLTIGAGAVSVSGTNTGDQVVPANEAGADNNFLTAYNSATGAWTKARPTWANIDKTTSSIADITTRSHTALTDIGTNTHAQIDTFIGTTVPNTYAPLVSPSLTTPTLGVASATSINIGSPEAPTAGRIYCSSTFGAFTNGSAQATLRSWSDTSGNGGVFTFYRQRGVYGTETAIQDGDLIGGIYAYSKDTGGTNRNGAAYLITADGAPTASSAPMKHSWYVSGKKKLELSNSGAFTVTGALTANTSFDLTYSSNLNAFNITNTIASATGSRGAGIVMAENDGAAMANGDRLGYILMAGSSSASSVRNSAGMVAYASENWVDGSAYGTKLDLETIPNGSTTRSAAISIDGNQGVTFTGKLLSPTVSGTFTYYATADVYSTITSGAYVVTRTADTNPALQTYISASGVKEANPKFVISISGKNSWGAGGASALDTYIERSAANTLRVSGGFVVGSAALATNATDGFLYIPTCAGTPTGTPTAYTGRVAMVFDTTNNKLYVYDGSWIDVT